VISEESPVCILSKNTENPSSLTHLAIYHLYKISEVREPIRAEDQQKKDEGLEGPDPE
jgi:hypothetical protein